MTRINSAIPVKHLTDERISSWILSSSKPCFHYYGEVISKQKAMSLLKLEGPANITQAVLSIDTTISESEAVVLPYSLFKN